jgi:hypothetical protein
MTTGTCTQTRGYKTSQKILHGKKEKEFYESPKHQVLYPHTSDVRSQRG